MLLDTNVLKKVTIKLWDNEFEIIKAEVNVRNNHKAVKYFIKEVERKKKKPVYTFDDKDMLVEKDSEKDYKDYRFLDCGKL